MIFFGILIGFYGYLFPGNINLMVIEIYAQKKYRFLIFTLVLILAFETIYCLMSLLLLGTFKSYPSIFNWIEVISYLMVSLMGIWMIFENKNNAQKSQRNTVVRGIFSIIFHPQQIPFWVIMGVFVNQFIQLKANNWPLYQFALLNAVGTFIAMVFYMIFGSQLFNYLQLNLNQINKIMGSVYLAVGFYGLFK